MNPNPELKWQTTPEIRKWIEDYEADRHLEGFVPAELYPLLKELLEHRTPGEHKCDWKFVKLTGHG